MSGLNQQFTKLSSQKWFREFESHILRNMRTIIKTIIIVLIISGILLVLMAWQGCKYQTGGEGDNGAFFKFLRVIEHKTFCKPSNTYSDVNNDAPQVIVDTVSVQLNKPIIVH